MADGSTKPISEVAIGDKVAATDPETGETTSQPVTTLHLNRDTELTEVTVSSTPASDAKHRAVGEGKGDRSTRGPTTTLPHTTTNHPFWDNSKRAWVDAGELTPGVSTLVGPDGQLQYVTKVHSYTSTKNMRDLTVATIHTYYVMAGPTPVLVHNNDCDYVDLYHGIGSAGAANIRANGVDPNYPSTYPRDYGDGFYTAPDRGQAEAWARKNFGDDAVVLHFRVPRADLAGLSAHLFRSGSRASQDFLRSNRSGRHVAHGYDVVEGPMLLNPEDFVAGAAARLGGHQVVFFGSAGGRVASMLDPALQ